VAERELMPPIPPLVCIVCVEIVEDPMSDEAEGWVLCSHSEHDDLVWRCPAHASGSDEFYGDLDRQMRDVDG
jgi:hypothetical protein